MKKPKEPILPYKPYKPTKPQLPPEEIEQTVVFFTMDLSNYDSYSFKDFQKQISSVAESFKKDHDKIVVEISCDVEHGYYDDVTAKASINFGEKKMIPNPSLKYHKDNHANNMKRYDKELALYESQMKEYENKLIEYKAALPAWEAYQHEKEIEFHQKKLEQLKKSSK